MCKKKPFLHLHWPYEGQCIWMRPIEKKVPIPLFCVFVFVLGFVYVIMFVFVFVFLFVPNKAQRVGMGTAPTRSCRPTGRLLSFLQIESDISPSISDWFGVKRRFDRFINKALIFFLISLTRPSLSVTLVQAFWIYWDSTEWSREKDLIDFQISKCLKLNFYTNLFLY